MKKIRDREDCLALVEQARHQAATIWQRGELHARNSALQLWITTDIILCEWIELLGRKDPFRDKLNRIKENYSMTYCPIILNSKKKNHNMYIIVQVYLYLFSIILV